MLETLEHVEARARRRKQDYVARFGGSKTLSNGIVHIRSMFVRSGVSDFRFDCFCVFADQNHFSHARLDQFDQRRVWRLLAASTKNQDDLSRFVRERCECFHRRIDAGRFRIVDEAHAVNLRHFLKPVFDWPEPAHRFAQRIRSGAASKTGSKRCQDILDVVSSTQVHFIAGHQEALAVFCARHELAPAQEQSLF